MTKIAIVVQRYGAGIIGGAEAHAKQLAERLTKDLGWDVHVLTTTARDYQTWANQDPEGMETLEGVTVHRFASTRGRSPLFPLFDKALKFFLPGLRRFHSARALVRVLERCWLVLQGPYCPKLVDHIESHTGAYDHFLFFTYLYYPTVWGHENVATKASLIPTAHDEFPFHFSLVSDMLNRIPRLLPNTHAEARLVEAKLESKRTLTVAGIGVDTEFFRPGRSDMKSGVTYLGRIGRGKNIDRMLAWCQTHFPDLPVRLAGKADPGFRLPSSKNVQHLGVISEEDKRQLLQSSLCVINPSNLESLSLIVLEAIACGVPALVNTNCDVLKNYTETCPTVFGFHDEQSFVVTLHQIPSTDWTSERKAAALEASRRWLIETYGWPRVLRTFQHTITPELGVSP